MVGEIKVVVVGDSSVGKSSLINTHCPPITGVEDASIARVCGVAFVLCDTFGAQRFRTLTSGFYKHARGVLIVFDVTDAESYQHVPQWMSEVRLRTHASMPVVVVANKCDLPATKRVVSRDGAMKLCADMEVGYTETSALLYSAQADAGGALTHALRLLLDRMPQTPAMTEAAKLSDDKKRRRHRSLAMHPGQKFKLPPIADGTTKKKKTGFLAALRCRCKGRVGEDARAAATVAEPPIYQLNSISRDAPQRR
jgi:small GTP-binding protein